MVNVILNIQIRYLTVLAFNRSSKYNSVFLGALTLSKHINKYKYTKYKQLTQYIK